MGGLKKNDYLFVHYHYHKTHHYKFLDMYWHGTYYVFGRYLIGTSVPDRYMVGTVRYCSGMDPSRIIDQWTVTHWLVIGPISSQRTIVSMCRADTCL